MSNWQVCARYIANIRRQIASKFHLMTVNQQWKALISNVVHRICQQKISTGNHQIGKSNQTFMQKLRCAIRISLLIDTIRDIALGLSAALESSVNSLYNECLIAILTDCCRYRLTVALITTRIIVIVKMSNQSLRSTDC